MDSIQLKETNLIFAEHEYLLEQDSLNRELISSYESLVVQYQLNDSLLTLQLKNTEKLNESYQKSIQRKSTGLKVLGGITGGSLAACIIMGLILSR